MEIKQTQALLCNKLLVAHIFHIYRLDIISNRLKMQMQMCWNLHHQSHKYCTKSKQKNADETFAFALLYCVLGAFNHFMFTSSSIFLLCALNRLSLYLVIQIFWSIMDVLLHFTIILWNIYAYCYWNVHLNMNVGIIFLNLWVL